jgi:hypothetical protein
MKKATFVAMDGLKTVCKNHYLNATFKRHFEFAGQGASVTKPRLPLPWGKVKSTGTDSIPNRTEAIAVEHA